MPASNLVERTSLPEALGLVLKTIEKSDEERALTLKEISKETGLNPRTVRKAVSLLEETKQFLDHKDLRIIRGGSGILLQIDQKKVKMMELPDDIQKLIIRTKYFPQPSREDEIQVYLYLKKAFDSKSAVFLENTPSVRKLMKQERIEKVQGEEPKFYLTEIGKMVALGALDIYPELERVA
jgi:DNA-binding transcriptional regulator YhcF (GntR family)